MRKEDELAQSVAPSLETEFTPGGSRFVPGDFIHVQFDGGSANGVGTGGFVILRSDGQELVRAGRYYG